MIGETNVVIPRDEVVNIVIGTNQEHNDDLNGVMVRVAYSDKTEEYVWNGNAIKVKIPVDVSYKVTFAVVEGYKKPEDFTATAVAGNVRDLVFTYYTEKVVVNVSADDGADMAGAVVSVDGTEYTWNGTPIVKKVAHGKSYSVVALGKSGFATPSSQTYTADSVSRNVSVVYEAIKDETLIVNVSASDGASVDGQIVTVKQNVANGVYIEDVNGKLWTKSEWDGSVTPNGVAVVTPETSFVISRNRLDGSGPYSNLTSLSGDIVTTKDSSVAMMDFNGYNNTVGIVKKDGTNSSGYYSLAKRCQDYTFPNGQKGYLGAAGEVRILYSNAVKVQALLNLIYGSSLALTHPSSTLYDSSNFWVIVGKGSVTDYDYMKDKGIDSWMSSYAFTHLKGETQPVKNGKATFTIPNGVTYEVSVSDKDGYVTPASQTFTAVGGTRTVSMQYLPLKITTIRINQTITDPASMITRIVDKGGIEAVRANSHRYTGTFANGVMSLKQLSDTDGTKYKDGSTATLDSAGLDVWMRLPQFYWKCSQYVTDQWDFTVAYGTKPDDSYKEWDGKDLIGVYEAYSSSKLLYSISGVSSKASVSQVYFKDYARARGEGYTLVKWKHHCMMAMLFYMWYGHTNSEAKVGSGTNSYAKKTGGTNSLGMTDTVAGGNGDSGSINFWGLENWWGNKYEFVDNVTVDNETWNITEDDGTIRSNDGSVLSNGYIDRMFFGENIDLIPTGSGGSSTTGFCDMSYISTRNSCVLRRSGYYNNNQGGICFVAADVLQSFSDSVSGTRLAFRGEIKIVG